eukprot:Skav224605  [mRNA]  locus=scaffold3477:30829:38035:- [translate_table: standard]
MIVANVGDSRVVLCQNGLAIPLSIDHKPNLPSERARVQRAGITHRVNGNLNLSRSIGDLDYKRNPKLSAKEQIISCSPDLIEKKREAQDEFLLIASDGIWDRISNQDAVDFVLERLDTDLPLSSITEALLDRTASNLPFRILSASAELRASPADNPEVGYLRFDSEASWWLEISEERQQMGPFFRRLVSLAFLASPSLGRKSSSLGLTCGNTGACDEFEVELAEEELAAEMQVELLQRMPMDIRLANEVAANSTAPSSQAKTCLLDHLAP